MRREKNESPILIPPPGETLLESIEKLGMSQSQLAERTGRPEKTINEIIKGKAAITHETALQLERVLSVPARFWNSLELNYRESLALEAERRELSACQEWLKTLPLTQMIKNGWVKKSKTMIDQAREVLNFFGIASFGVWDELLKKNVAVYRKSTAFKSNPVAVTSWLRRGEILSREVDCAPYDKERLKSKLNKIRSLTLLKPLDFIPKLRRLCSECGIVMVIVPEINGTRLCGVAKWLTKSKALIQLSLRYKTADVFWFTFFHEIGHILLHGKRNAFIDSQENNKDSIEDEANLFASNLLISPSDFASFRETPMTELNISNFAKKVGIAPGIFVGRLQHEKLLKWNQFNHMKEMMKFE